MTLLQLNQVTFGFGGTPLLQDVSWIVHERTRTVLVGQNGVGKSTLLKLLRGDFEPEEGHIYHGTDRVAMLSQDLPSEQDTVVFDYVCQAASDPLHEHENKVRAEEVITQLQLPRDALISTLSGGWQRRVALGRVLASDADLLLLDEPSNHLDIPTIEWLEKWLTTQRASVIMITHDRKLADKVATEIAELDRGTLRLFPGNFEKYLEKKALLIQEEDRANALFDKKLADEEVWIRQGVKARRTRNEGRVRRLEALREQRQARQARRGDPKFGLNSFDLSGQIVSEMHHVDFAYNNKPILQDFSFTLCRGDKLGIIGPNGCGKSTFLKLMLGDLKPQPGTIKLGSNITLAYFDQLRATLDLDKTAIQNVAGDSDTVIKNGEKRHILTYLRDFLFSPERARLKARALSGGERNRLMLAKLFSQSSNLLILDEPTNDLDIESLELLEDLFIDYQGTLILVSHDRSFLDNVVTQSIVFTGPGKVKDYVGGFADYCMQAGVTGLTWQNGKAATKSAEKPESDYETRKREQREAEKHKRDLAALEKNIAKFESEKKQLSDKMGQADFYALPINEQEKLFKQSHEIESKLSQALETWEKLLG